MPPRTPRARTNSPRRGAKRADPQPVKEGRMKTCILLCSLLLACAQDNRGIGTSPNYDDVEEPITRTITQSVNPADLATYVAPTCGIWIASSVDEADALAESGHAPDVLVFTAGHTTCADAIAISR